MLANPALVLDVLTSAMVNGVTTVETKKLIYALGGKQDRAAVWVRLLDAWQHDLDNPRDTLCGFEIEGTIVLIRMLSRPRPERPLQSVMEWAGE